jgi:hypothetical protein
MLIKHNNFVVDQLFKHFDVMSVQVLLLYLVCILFNKPFVTSQCQNSEDARGYFYGYFAYSRA